SPFLIGGPPAPRLAHGAHIPCTHVGQEDDRDRQKRHQSDGDPHHEVCPRLPLPAGSYQREPGASRCWFSGCWELSVVHAVSIPKVLLPHSIRNRYTIPLA